MKLTEMRTRINAVAKELGELAQKEERSAEEESRLDALLAEINDLGPKLEREQSIQDAAGNARKMGESRGRVSGFVPDAETEEREQGEVDRRSIGKRFATSEQIETIRKFGGKRSDPFAVGSFYHRDDATVQHRDGMTPQEVRALIQTGNLPANYIQPQFVPGFFRGDDLVPGLRDVLINGQTNSDAILFFRELLFTNNAAAVAQATTTGGSSGLKPESAITFEEAQAPVATIAHWIPITRQTIQDAAQMQTYVEQRLLDGLRLEESDQLLNGDGTGANMTGILETSGIQELDATYFGTNPVADDGTSNENFNRLLRGKTLVRSVGRARASFALLNPADNEKFLTSTDANRQYFGAGPFSATGVPPLWGLRVVEDENIAAGTALVGDGRMAAVWDRMQSQILIDTINDQFVRNMLTILAEERLALTVFRPAAFAVVALV